MVHNRETRKEFPMKKSILREYARLIARSGVNVQPGQEVFIAAELDQPEFVKMLV